MRFAPWSLVYLAPAAAYALWLVAGRRTLLDPLLFGGVYLGLMFLLDDPHGNLMSTQHLLLLHLAASGAYWSAGLIAFRRARRFAQARSLAPRTLARPLLWLWFVAATWGLALVIFFVLFEGSLETMMAMRHRPELMLGSLVSEASNLVRLAYHLRSYLLVAALMALFLWCRRPSPGPLPVTVLVLTLAVAGLLIAASGSRGNVLFLGLHSYFILHYGLEDRPALRRAAKAAIVGAMPVVLMTILVQTLYRDTGLEAAQTMLAIEDRAQEAVNAIFDHLSFNDEVQFVLSTYDQPEVRIRGHSLLTPLIAFVPRTIWPEKPIPWGRELAWRYGYQFDTTVSLAATVPGEGYANFGLIGWILFPFGFAFAIGWTSYFLHSGRDDTRLLWGLWSLHWAFALRGDLHTVISGSIMPALLMLVLVRAIGVLPAAERVQAAGRRGRYAALGWHADLGRP
jgi:hypothetical protein